MKQTNKLFWDKVAGVYGIFTNLVNRKVHAKLKPLVASLIEKEDNVLECACGNGLLTKEIAKKCKNIVATDISEKMLSVVAKKLRKYPNVKLEQGDIMKINYADEEFNKVVAGDVIHLLDNPSGALKELARVCAIGGTIIIPTYMNKKKKQGSFIKNIDKAGADFKQQFSVDTYKEFFISEGYPDVKIEFIEGKIPCAVAVIKKK